MQALDLRGLVPAPITPFTRDGAVDYPAIKRLGAWLGSIEGVKGLTVLGHAGEGTFLERDEQFKVIEAFRNSTDGRIPIIAGITLETIAQVAKAGAHCAAVAGDLLNAADVVARARALRLARGRGRACAPRVPRPLRRAPPRDGGPRSPPGLVRPLGGPRRPPRRLGRPGRAG